MHYLLFSSIGNFSNKEKILNFVIILIILSLNILLFLIVEKKYPPINPDEVVYTSVALNYIEKRTWGVPMWYGSVGKEWIDFIPYGRLTNFTNYLMLKIIGKYDLHKLRILPLIYSCISLIFTFLIAKEFFNNKTAILSMIILSISPLFFWLSKCCRPEMFLCAWCVGTFYFLLRILKVNRYNNLWLIIGIISTLACDIHALGFFLPIFVLVSYFIFSYSRNKKGLLFLIFGFFLGILYWIGVHYLPNKDIFFLQAKYGFWTKPGIGSPAPVIYLSKDFFSLLMSEIYRYINYFLNARYYRNLPILIYLFFSAIFFYRSNLVTSQIKILISIYILSNFIYYTLMSGNKGPQFILPLLPFFVMIISFWLNSISSLDKHKHIGRFLIVLIISMFIVQIIYTTYYYRNCDYEKFSKNLRRYIPSNKSIMCADLFFPIFVDTNKVFSDMLFLDYKINEKFYSEKNIIPLDIIKNNNIEYLIVPKNKDRNIIFYFLDEKFINENCFYLGEVEDEFYGEPVFGNIHTGIKTSRITQIFKILNKN
ncbi:MAG: glycosyltransferase family 39 protein [Endomicrobia bacterium]|nr:glycosyltransferase family 39 protein [Endomicrobiia bacterium]